MQSPLSPKKRELLQAFLSGLPIKLALELATAVERDRLAGGKALPHDLILEGLRPALRQATGSGHRIQTPLRIFCTPFEDLFIEGDRTRKQTGRIARSSIAPVWDWLSQTLMPEKHAALCDELGKAILQSDDAAINRSARELWSVSGALMIRAMPNNASGRPDLTAATRKLGCEMIAADAYDMARVLEAGEQFSLLKAQLDPFYETITESAAETFKGLYREIYEHYADSAPYFPLLLMARLKHPAGILKVLSTITHQNTDELVAKTDMALAGELLFEDLEDSAAALTEFDYRNFDVETVVKALDRFTHLSSGITLALGVRKDGHWGQRLLNARSHVGDHMAGLMERAEADIRAALPLRRFGGYGAKGPRIPDISVPPDKERSDRALRLGEVIYKIRGMEERGAFAAAYKEAVNELDDVIALYGEHLCEEIRKAEGDVRSNAMAYKDIAVKLSRYIQGEEASGLLERRANAAAR